MNVKRLEQILAAYGARPERWPATEREAAEALLARDPHAQRLLREARRLDGLLDSLPAQELQIDASSLAARLSERPQEPTNPRAARAARSRWWHLPIIMPNLVGLAAAAAAGFWIGWSDPGNDSASVSDLVPYIADLGGEENSLW
ncbi:MAG TPA: hypothetical protein VHA10_07750 [Hypericibacter adhaerens]|jgi:hypothetical protein|uniref:Uncharacterized protein n=1 Tax=Hypericibacter adhaerens TaxID=2602016 RepID=A0A5J6N531_9PROT|nr:hypothetical protein [Hypericibacter adhaerens]QEX23883.1 hypothetical protein FRZ61_38220 [Hypericibacter adhaerens]HWA43089.1 hypothetical protein [Hypericibacter adhaerens]